MANPYMIGITGGTASGKTSIAKIVCKRLQNAGLSCQILSMDNFYKSLNEAELLQAAKADYNFDHPKAFDLDFFAQKVQEIKHNKFPVTIPTYDFETHTRSPSIQIEATDIIIFEGIMLFVDERIRLYFDQKIFVDVDADTRLIRRIRRDIKDRGRDLENILTQYEKFVKESFDTWVYPTKIHADIIIPRGRENVKAIKIMVDNLLQLHSERVQTTCKQTNTS